MIKLATLCYIKKNGKTLMLHRIKKENDIHWEKWNGLGGKLEEDESPKECVIREVFEESGLILNKVKFVGFITFPKFDQINDTWQVFIYVCNDFSGDLITNSKEGILSWIDDSNLTNLNLWEGDKLFLKWINENKKFIAKFTYKGSKLIKYDVDFIT